MARIAVVDISSALSPVLERGLAAAGHELAVFGDAAKALRELPSSAVDLLLVRVEADDPRGLEVCRRAKADPALRDMRVVVITAVGADGDLGRALAFGVDDYIAEPFTPGELAWRVDLVLRTAPGRDERGRERVVHGDLEIDLGRFEARHRGEALPLTPTELRLLHSLAVQPGRVLLRGDLCRRAIGRGVHVQGRNIDVHVRALRKKLGPAARFIATVRGIGYRFVAPDA